jgi:hypothetical protein
VLRHQGKGFAFDQVADPSAVAVNGRAYIWYDGDNNQQGSAGIGLATAPHNPAPLADRRQLS